MCEETHVCGSNGRCVHACLLNNGCGPNAECYAIRHQSHCRCLPGFEGNAFSGCHPIGCKSNSECPISMACYSGECLNPCVRENPCANHAECLVSQHFPQCRCDIGYTGNGRIQCLPLPEPECVEDSNCPSKMVCMDEKCINPCVVLQPCTKPGLNSFSYVSWMNQLNIIGFFSVDLATCDVADTFPIRRILCQCPNGFYTNEDNICLELSPIIVGCTSNDDCGDPEACINAMCKDPCACGPNAECTVENHHPVCTCKVKQAHFSESVFCIRFGFSQNNALPSMVRFCLLTEWVLW